MQTRATRTGGTEEIPTEREHSVNGTKTRQGRSGRGKVIVNPTHLHRRKNSKHNTGKQVHYISKDNKEKLSMTCRNMINCANTKCKMLDKRLPLGTV